MRKIFLFVLFYLPFAPLSAQPGTEPVKVTDMLKIKTVSSLSLDKTGEKAVFTVTGIEPEGEGKTEYKYVNQLWMVAADGRSVPRQLTYKENASQAAFSPDGKQIAFTRAIDGRAQVFLLSLDGGEAIQLTSSKYGASGPQWSPDGKKILFASSIPIKDLLKDSLLNPGKEVPPWPWEKPFLDNHHHLQKSSTRPDPDGSPEEVRAWLQQNETDNKALVVNRLNFQNESDVSVNMIFTHYFIMDARAGAKALPVTKGFYSFNNAAFTPDGKQLVLGGDMDSLEHPDRSLESQVYLLNLDGSGIRKLLGEPGKTFTSPRLSPSGKWLAFLHGNTSFVSIPTLAVIPVNGSFGDRTEIPFDRSKGNLQWGDDDTYLYFTAASHGGQPVFRVDMATKKSEQLTANESGVSSFDIAGNRMAFVKTEIKSPFELYISDANGKNQQSASFFNTEWVKTKKLSFPEKRTFTNDNGQEIEYWIMKPSFYEPGKTYPLLLEIHGGPSAMWGPGESTMWHEYQYFCSKGYGVVYCNPRGSGGYGLDFLRSNINNWGAGPASDVLTALDKTIAAERWVDRSRLLITGGSYAGYLVSWIIAHDKRFKGACSQRGVYDLATFFGEGNAWRLVPNYFGGYPWEAETKATLERESPINYVQHITTPYIIFHGENDRRTGVIQSEMLYRSLKVLGRPVEYVRHPGATHEITRSGNNRQRIDQMLRIWEFFERCIRKKF